MIEKSMHSSITELCIFFFGFNRLVSFFFSSNVTEHGRGVTITAALCTHYKPALPVYFLVLNKKVPKEVSKGEDLKRLAPAGEPPPL